ncbi:uncharacterized protein LOC127440742 isoform X2 [Myxocyprinus asiaticus]|uniref:uncharacterized protein LOC127440742 isoform X2 n=1 Tax=Myxocyprinus asiaticus TaxID=70543 RepID=UPI0022225353|nr:uncharacterized protein LOC127440742 isoform X2 [Myxocyprinus asiaticus]
MAPGTTKRQCSFCNQKIGNASKTCCHCGMKVAQKKKLKAQKIKYNNQWAAKLKKDRNFSKVMNSVDLLLHKLEVLGVFPMLFITKQRGRQRSSGVLMKDHLMQSHPSLPAMQQLYDTIVRDQTEVKEESQELSEVDEKQQQQSRFINGEKSSSCSETENNLTKIKNEDTEEQRENMYHIVSFADNEEVEVVPAIWVKDDVCFWPPYKNNRIQKAIKSLEQPQENWTPYIITVIYTADNYYEVLKKIPLMEQQIDVLSKAENDSLRPPKRKIKRNTDLLTSADAVQNPATSTASLSPEWWSKISGSPQRQDVNISEQPQQQTAQQLWQEQSCVRPSLDQLNQVSWQQPLLDQEDPESSMHQRHGNNLCCHPFLGSILQDLLNNQEIMKEQQRSLMRMVQDLQTNNTQEIITVNDLDQRRLPVEDLASLMALENDIRSCPDTRRKVVLTLGLLGGVDVKDTVWRVMKQTMKNDLAKMVNWRGVNGKTSFQSLELKNVVIEAVRRNPLCAQSTAFEVEKVIRRWFHLAGDREGGRKRRTPLQHVNPEN